MKNKNNKITNKLMSLSGLARQSLFLLFLFVTLSSCSNILSKDVKTDNNTYVTIVPGDVSVRSVGPTQEYALEHLTSITFYAKKTGKSRDPLAGSLSSLSELYNRQFILANGAGEYTFELLGTIDGINFYDKLENIVIEDSKTNAISFDLTPVNGSSGNNLETPFEAFGGISVKLNFNKANVKKIHYKLQDFSNWDSNLGDSGDWAIVEQGDITSFSNISNSSYNSKATYNHLANNTTGSTARLPVGQYRLTFDFLTEDTSLNDFVVINSFPYIVNVEKGRNSYLEENFDLNQVYTITYNANGGSLDLGARMQTKFTSKHEVMLPRMQKDGYTFQGWYTTSTFDTGTGPIEKVETGTTENKPFYAKFANSAIYVDAVNGNNDNDGSKNNPVKTLAAAIGLIQAQDIETTNQSNLLNWYIFVKGTITESLVISLNEDQMALPLKANGICFVGASDLINGEPQDVIQGDGTKPVFTIATSTQVHFKNIKITGGKDSEGYDGAGIVMKGYSIVTIEDGTFITGNTASTNGGGIAVFNNANLMLAGGKITGNTCGTDKHGNDIYCSDSGNISVGFTPVVGDLYLPQYKKVNLIDNMTNGASITITPEVYSAVSFNEEWLSLNGQELISVPSSPMPGMDIIEIKDNNDYFHITPQTGNDIEWFIDDNGYLNRNYMVTFKGTGIETPLSKTVQSTDTIPSTEDPAKNISRTGYSFAGWVYKAENSSIRQFAFDNGEQEDYDNKFSHIQSDMDLYAAWIYDTDEIHVSVTDGVDIADLDSSNNLIFGDGSATAPLKSIQGALEVITMINDPDRDYTIVINGMTEEYNITIDDTIPAKSITLQGKNEPAAGEDPVDGILHGDGMYSDPHNPYQSLLLVSDNANVILKNIQIQMVVQAYDIEGLALKLSSGANVTLDQGATFAGSEYHINPHGVIAVEEDASLIMNEGSIIKGFGVTHGAIYVKEGGSFTMNGGSIINNFTSDGGAVHVSGGQFEMNGGTISENTTYCQSYLGNEELYGAGVCLVSGSFTMTDGSISNNTAYTYTSYDGLRLAGGGVFVYADASFTMEGGTISGNKALNALSVDGELITTMSAYGGGVCLQASGSKLASFTMTGGTISGNTSGTSGNGIGFLGSLDDGKTGTISLGADAIITDNDIYLPSNITITIVEPMTGGLTPSIRATITPAEYKANQPILNNDGVSLEYEYDYFAVTPQSDGTITTNWFIDASGKLYKYSVGDLLLTDGTFVYYDENHTFSEDEVSAAVGLVYDLDEDGLPKGIIGLKNSMSYNGLTTWAPQSSTGYNIKFEEIICTPSDTGGNITFEGDTDGSDNWDYICEIDQAGSAYPATNYPAFNYALNYAETAGLTHSDYDSGWYMPSAAEMYDISMNLTTINSVLTKIKDINSASANTLSGYYFWTSSQADAAEVGNSAWYINITATSNPFTSSNKDWDSPSVCCIHKYEKQ